MLLHVCSVFTKKHLHSVDGLYCIIAGHILGSLGIYSGIMDKSHNLHTEYTAPVKKQPIT